MNTTIDEPSDVVMVGGGRVVRAHVSDVAPHPLNPRTRLTGISELAASIASAGLLHGLSQGDIAKRTGVSHGQVAKRLSLLRLPDKLATQLEDGDLSTSEALTLLALPEDDMVPTLRQARANTYRTLAEWVQARKTELAAKAEAEKVRAELAAAGVEVVDNARAVLGDDMWQHQLPAGTTLADLVDRGQAHDVIATLNVGSQVHVWFWSRTIPTSALTAEDDDLADVDEVFAAARDRIAASGGSTDGQQTALQTERAAAYQRAAEHDAAQKAAQEKAKAAREEAAIARHDACAQLVTQLADHTPDAEVLALRVLTDAVVAPYVLENVDAWPHAARWIGADTTLGIDPDEVDAEVLDTWAASVGDAGGWPATRFAVAVLLADLEDGLNAPYRYGSTWTTREARHVRLLAEHAEHQVSPWEQEQLAKADTAAAEQAEQLRARLDELQAENTENTDTTDDASDTNTEED